MTRKHLFALVGLISVFVLGLVAATGSGRTPPCRAHHQTCSPSSSTSSSTSSSITTSTTLPTTTTTTSSSSSTTTTTTTTTTTSTTTTSTTTGRWLFTAIHSSWNNGDVGAAGLGFDAITVSPDVARLDTLQRNGLKGLIWLGGYDNTTCTFVNSDDWVRTHVAAVKDHPAVLAYEIDNEPHLADCPTAPAQMVARNALVKSIDPNALTYLTLYKDFAAFHGPGHVDAVRISRYPNSFTNGLVLSKITNTAAEADAAGWTRQWAGVQTFGDGYYKMPTPFELQAIINTWAATHAEAIVAYTWNYTASGYDNLDVHPELFDVWRATNQ